MEIAISIVVAYLLTGIGQVVSDLIASLITKPAWSRRPTVGGAILAGATWFVRPFIGSIRNLGRLEGGRHAVLTIASGLLGIILQMSVLTAFVWGCIALSQLISDSTVLQVVAAAGFVVIGAALILPLLVPLISLIVMPLAAIILLPLDLLLPTKNRVDVREIKWCRNCKHYRKSGEYEDTLRGLRQSVSMPRSDKLPCSIPLETAEVWQRFYATELRSRTLFPKDCAFFEDQHAGSGSSKSR
jgi:hypothetical protein